MTYLIFDLLLLIIIVVGIFIGAHKGAIKIFLSFIAIIVAAYLAHFLSTPTAVFVNNTFFEPKIVNAVENSVNSSTESIKEALPDFIINNSERLGIDLDTNNIIDADKFVNESVSPIIEDAVSGILQFVLFIILAIVLNLCVKLINKLVKGSFLTKPNKFFGGVFGAATGVVIIIVLLMLCERTCEISGKGLWIISETTLNQSYIYNFYTGIF